MEDIIGYAVGGLMIAIGLYFSMSKVARQIGELIPGKDPVEEFADTLDDKVTPIIEKIESYGDMLSATTHGGVGHGPENPAGE